jgi:dihydrofolate reductase
MTKVFAMMSVSLDGYVSGPNGGPGLGLDVNEPIFDWYYSGDHPSREYPDHGFSLDQSNIPIIDFAGARTGAVVCGRGTYETSGRWGGAGPHPTAPLFVVSDEPVDDADPRQSIVTSGVAAAVHQARLAAGPHKDVAVMGGATITAALIKGLLDEIVMNLRPVLLGGGARLFRDLPAAVRLEQTSVIVNNRVTHLTYRVMK